VIWAWLAALLAGDPRLAGKRRTDESSVGPSPPYMMCNFMCTDTGATWFIFYDVQLQTGMPLSYIHLNRRWRPTAAAPPPPRSSPRRLSPPRRALPPMVGTADCSL
jgi:hypothetical protein